MTSSRTAVLDRIPANTSTNAQALAFRLVMQADSKGRFLANPRLIGYKCWPFWFDPTRHLPHLEGWLRELLAADFIRWSSDPLMDTWAVDEPNPTLEVTCFKSLRRTPMPQRVRQLVLERDGRYCRHCGTTERLTIDHITPVRHGGRLEDPENLQVLCQPCNSRKGARVA